MMSVSMQQQEYALSPAERMALRDLADRATDCLPGQPQSVRFLLQQIPDGVLKALTAFAAGGSPLGYLVLRGLDVGVVPSTPPHAQGFWPHPSTGMLALVAEALGGLAGYADEKDGALIHDVVPVRGEEHRIENSGSVRFDLHTENAHHALRPDFLSLLCLRQDHEGVATTCAASVRAAVEHLDPPQVALLRRPVYRTRFPMSFTRDGQVRDPVSPPHPVIFGYGEALFIRYNSHNTQSPDKAGAGALRTLSRALDMVSRDLVLGPGELLVVDNYVAVHGRSAFTPRYDGQDRWLRRAYSVHLVPRWAREMSGRPRVIPPVAEIRGVL